MSETANKRVQFDCIDYCKLFCALLVVLMHCLEITDGHPIGECLVKCMSQQAVPYFLIVSGFLFRNNFELNIHNRRTKNHLFRIFKSYIIWVILWSPALLLRYLDKYPDKSYLYIVGVVFRRVFFAGEGVYWYLLVLFISLMIICLFGENIWKLPVVIVVFLFWILGLWYEYGTTLPLMSSVFSAFYNVFSWSNNFLMKGLPYTLLGVWCSDHYPEIKNLPLKKTIVLYLSLCLVNISVFVLIAGSKHHVFVFPFQAMLLFFFSINTVHSTKKYQYAIYCRELSTVIYLLHTVFVFYVADVLFSVNAALYIKFSISVGLSVLVYVFAKLSDIVILKRILMIK